MQTISPQRGLRRASRAALTVVTCVALAGCGGLTDLGTKPGVPAGVQDPATYRTPAGAMQMYWTTRAQFQRAVVIASLATGVLTDELQADDDALDRRTPYAQSSVALSDAAYEELQAVRTYAVQARGALAKYDPSAPTALRGEAYAVAGYAEVLLADLFCSGVPLSELEFEGDFVYHAGSTTQEVYRHALTLFDSALVLATDSARILNFARVGKGRALVALGEYDAAARAVAAVPTDYQYAFPVYWDQSTGCHWGSFVQQNQGASHQVLSCLGSYSVSDAEGGVGLPFRSSGDPRTAAPPFTSSVGIHNFPNKYGMPGGTSPVVAASGFEARLIEAEAALQPPASPSGPWLQTLNALRTDGTFATTVRRDPQTGDSVGVDTLWNAGTGGVAGLRPLTDPGTASARVDLLFAERAAWLFVDGHRQGDLRRLVRSVSKGGYERSQAAVYPRGRYQGLTGTAAGTYGTDVTAPVPAASERPNRLFIGCIDREA